MQLAAELRQSCTEIHKTDRVTWDPLQAHHDGQWPDEARGLGRDHGASHIVVVSYVKRIGVIECLI